MRLPAEAELVSAAQFALRDHDLVELHATRPIPSAVGYRVRLSAIESVAKARARSGIAIELGCAQGNIAHLLGTAGWYAIGIDLRADFLAYAAMKTETETVAWVAASIEALPLRPECANLVILGEVIEHVAFPEQIVKEAARLLAPGGILIVTTPNGHFLRARLPTLAGIADRHAIADFQFQPDADGHLFLATREELIILGTGAGLEFVEHRFFQSPPITGWPRWQRVAARLPLDFRLSLERAIQRAPRLGRRLSVAQLAAFRRAIGEGSPKRQRG